MKIISFKNGVNILFQQITLILQLPKVITQIKCRKFQLGDYLEVGKVDLQFLVYENPLGIQQQQNKIVPLKNIQL